MGEPSPPDGPCMVPSPIDPGKWPSRAGNGFRIVITRCQGIFASTLRSLKNPSGSPSARAFASTAYDPAHHVTVLFGGLDSVHTGLNDTWTWDGSTWTQQNPAKSPAPRNSAAMAYDSTHHYVLLFGGQGLVNGNVVYFHDTWAWTGSNWRRFGPATLPPARASFEGMANDPQATGTLMYGGFDATQIFADTWSWTGTNWQQLTPATSPGPLDPALAYSSTSSRVVLFGGYDGSTWHNETWAFDGTRGPGC
jgi:hypothetical protein